MRLTEAAEPVFARHETFHPRYGWFRKAYTFASRNGNVFGQDDAPVVIGVGKNMVRAIRFWGLAAKLIAEDPSSSNRRTSSVVPTPIGHALFGESGWDRYMEDPGTLWLLHWLLLAPPSRLPVWWLAFSEFNAVEFTDDDLEASVNARIGETAGWTCPNSSSLKKDVGALLRTYAPAQGSGRASLDDSLDCPLRELRLIVRAPSAGRYRFVLGPKPTLPSAIVAYAALDYAARAATGSRSVTFSRLANESGAPGRAFKLSEPELLEAIEPAVSQMDAVDVSIVNGVAQLRWSDDLDEVLTAVLDRYYGAVASMTADQARHGRPLEGVR